MMSTQVTYGQLEQLLAALGLERTSCEGRCHAYYHLASDTLVLLPAAKADTPARSADLLSIQRDLVEGGHLDEQSLNKFLATGSLPVAH